MTHPSCPSHRRSGLHSACHTPQAGSESNRASKHNVARLSGNRGTSALRSSGASSRELKLNWRARHTDKSKDSHDSDTENVNAITDMMDSLDLSATADLPSLASYRTVKQPDRIGGGAGDSMASEQPTQHRDNGLPEDATTLPNRLNSVLKRSDEYILNVLGTKRLAERSTRRGLQIFQLSHSEESSKSMRSETSCILTPTTSDDRLPNEELAYLLARMQSTATNEHHGHQMMAALPAANVTPEESKTSPRENYVDVGDLSNSRLDSSVSYAGSSISQKRSRKFTSTDSGLSLSSESYQKAEPLGVQPVAANWPLASRGDMDDRFHKMIRKLQRPSRLSRRLGQTDSGVQSDEDHPTAQQQRYADDQTTYIDHRTPVQGKGRRINTESDYAVEYWPGMRPRPARGRLEDLGHGDLRAKDGMLNPKAREFLTSQESLRLVRRTQNSSVSDYDFSEQATSFSRPYFVGTSQSPQQQIVSDDAQSGARPGFPAVAVKSEDRLYEVSRLPGTQRAGRPDPMNWIHPLRLVPLHAGMLQGDIASGRSVLAGTIPNHHDGVPWTGSSDLIDTRTLSGDSCSLRKNDFGVSGHGSAVPAAAAAATAVSQLQPRPVSKPKRPNPKDQQEYEAWVEWRKANEPGYAMACKLRQQRRAQRNLQQRPKMMCDKKT